MDIYLRGRTEPGSLLLDDKLWAYYVSYAVFATVCAIRKLRRLLYSHAMNVRADAVCFLVSISSELSIKGIMTSHLQPDI